MISVQLVLLLSRLVLCSPTSRSGSLSMLRALELISPPPSISCPGAAKGLGFVPRLLGLCLGWGTGSSWPVPGVHSRGYLRAVMAQLQPWTWVATLPVRLGISLLNALVGSVLLLRCY